MNSLIQADQVSFFAGGETIIQLTSFHISTDECVTLIGESGSGKTILGKIIAGHYKVTSGTLTYAEDKLRKVFVHQQHDFRFAFHSRSYFGQRFDRNYEGQFPTVRKILAKDVTETAFNYAVELLKLEEKLDQPVIELSNGEGKRVQLAQALLLNPQLLILDQPFIGLDPETRKLLHELIAKLKNEGVTVIVITSADEIPNCTNRIFLLKQGHIEGIYSPENLPKTTLTSAEKKEIEWHEIERLTPQKDNSFKVAVQLNNINIKFEEKVILNNVSWTVNKGEHWALIGHNGSGKSTLLSLINADNPQAYLNDVHLFDKRRGGGESIWDIKEKIGYVSPEMHLFFQRTGSYIESISLSTNDHTLDGFSQEQTSCYEAVCSGFNDQMGSSADISYNQQSLVLHWMEALDLKHLRNKPFYKTSLGEQRLLLLVRALIKNPPLLLLDEPCQGLDKQQTQRFTSIVDDICCHFEKTLIYVSHYSNEMPSCINHRLVLENGSVKEMI